MLAGSVLVVILSALLLSRLDMHTTLLNVMQQVEDAGYRGRLLFIVVVCLCVIGLVPSVLLTLGAGALYGVIGGSLTMAFAQVIGSTIPFLLARFFFHKQVNGLLNRRVRLQRAMAVIRPHDWKMIALVRMIPFFPYKLSNYVFGITPVAFTPYVLGTLIGIWPMTVFNVYLGSLTADLLFLGSTDISRSPWQWTIWICGLIFSGVVVFALVRRATAILQEHAVLLEKGIK